MSYTPGPWHIGMRNGANSNLVYAYNGTDAHNDTPICSVYGMYQHAEIHEQKQNEGLANARLIAATPELLEALKLCESNISSLLASAHPKVFGVWLEVVRAAIAKATGGTA